ncbi:ABC transporter substrate-binding protein [Shouchella clausii]|uniref:ABC transporter substrate-binding protein n=1 Tax=Shouchella clausii TaxID=79880 RepID=A0A268S669_SHOCL|nr:ABC transporter substrate-binding protein [Shouchella clausii]PAD42745.1 ABC transporter substrate-binding protein [Bacillus sp. 7520-S]PAE98273.1 ABC transporter substrate-binding protein [Shouchella clausii]PAF28068.1 ABC transporter substrate-binding protein [Shouchella clausii]
MKKAKMPLFSAALLAVFVLGACGGDETGTDGNGTGEQNNNGGEESSSGGTLIFARGGDSQSLDYASVTDGESSRVTKQIYETLIEFADDSFELEPGLAKDWDVDDDGLRYVFYLQEGVTFHDGTPFNADAVKTNFERWADPDHQYAFTDEGYSYSVYGTQFGGFKGDEGHVIEEINVIDDYEVEFVLSKPLGSFLQNMGMSYFAITSPAALEEYGADIDENPVGTGPFKFVSWTKDASIVLEKNEDYWQEGLPKLDGVTFQVIPDNSARLTALQSGEIDLMDGLAPDDAAMIEGQAGLTTFERTPNNVGYLGFNIEKEPFDDVRVRQAINHAIDKNEIINNIYGGLAEPAANAVPKDYLGHNDDVVAYEYDMDKAKELLEEAGYGDGFEFDLWTMPVSRPYMPDPEQAAVVIQDALSELNITANIVTKEWATYLEEIELGYQDMFMLGWSGVNGDPDYFLGSLLSTDGIPGSNQMFFSNEEVDALLAEAKTTIDPDERAALYEEAQLIIHEEAPMVPLVHAIPALAGVDTISGYVPHPSTSESLKHVEISN